MGKLFGTDGVRGIANQELTPELAFRLGRAGGAVLARAAREQGIERPALIIGRDTRISGPMLESALVAGLNSAGVDAWLAGVIPTPAVAYLIRNYGAQGGVVISASHNPAPDNGIKFFGPSGYKLTDEQEETIEALLGETVEEDNLPRPTGAQVGRVQVLADAEERYLTFLKSTISGDLRGLKVVVDCANGAAYRVSPRLLRELGAEVVVINDQPDGLNINAGCGSTHLEALQQAVLEHGAMIGLAHDGDADRVLAVDERGQMIDGDMIMALCALEWQKQGRLKQDTLVVTVMTNLGLHLALKPRGIRILETKVGDRYVLEEMLASGAVLGGEQSGHIIFLDYNTTGDGVLTGLQLLHIIKEAGQPASQTAAVMERLPQLLVNVRVKDKQAAMSSIKAQQAIQQAEQELAGQGRILVRPSGTEPLIRVMGEGREAAQVERLVREIAAIFEQM